MVVKTSADKYALLGNDYHWTWLARGEPYSAWVINCLSLLPMDGTRSGVPIRVLDFGCGDGVPASMLAERRYEVFGYDIHPGAIEVARARVPKATFSPALPKPLRGFEFMIALGVIEHMESPGLLVEAARTVGHCLLAFPREDVTDPYALNHYTVDELIRLFHPMKVRLVMKGTTEVLLRIT